VYARVRPLSAAEAAHGAASPILAQVENQAVTLIPPDNPQAYPRTAGPGVSATLLAVRVLPGSARSLPAARRMRAARLGSRRVPRGGAASAATGAGRAMRWQGFHQFKFDGVFDQLSSQEKVLRACLAAVLLFVHHSALRC
jgi:hypothetical protein